MRTLLRKIKFWYFNLEFGFVPSEMDPRVHIAEQAVVDAQLSRCASAYRTADRSEQASTEALKKVGSAKDLVAARSNLRWCQEGVQGAKERFWRAHKLAKNAGFSVKPRYTDYLDYSIHRWE